MSTTKTPKTKDASPSADPIDIVVRRGAVRRFDQLQQKAAGLPVRLSWDRRTAARRLASNDVSTERRRQDRRQSPPFTWDTADFLVVGDRPQDAADPAVKRRRG